jgi:iron complex outermembrane receptor protein
MGRRAALRATVACAALAAATLSGGAAAAQETTGAAQSAIASEAVAEEEVAASEATQASDDGAIVVTGSRIIRNGFSSPIPVSVISQEEIESRAQTNLVDLVNTLPAVAPGVSSTQGNYAIAAGVANGSVLNLRGLGTTRTLVLLDGRRVVPAALNNTVDVGVLPEALISRIDVVTGGASAAYGSDAVSGVVNFVLDKKFSGVKGAVQGGVSTYGDNPNYRIALAGGTGFAEDRGHVLMSAELAFQEGIRGWDCNEGVECNGGNAATVNVNPRAWMRKGWAIVTNPNYTATNGQPLNLVIDRVGLSTGAPGGMITSGPLRNIYFGPGGTPRNLQYEFISSPFIRGGSWLDTNNNYAVDLVGQNTRASVFSFASYDVADNITLYGQAMYSRAHGLSVCCGNVLTGTRFTVRSENPFIPASIRQAMTDQGISSFQVGSTLADVPAIKSETWRSATTFVVGAGGNFDFGGSNWIWDASAQFGRSRFVFHSDDESIIPNLNQAVDAVRASNGAVVCRVALTDPATKCVPFNIMGVGVNSQAAIDFVTGSSQLRQIFNQNVYQASVSGNLFSTWAGPVSLAAGGEYRTERTTGESDPLSRARVFWSGNYQPTFGRYNVLEGFVETAVPLAKDMAWAADLELNAAVRATNYSTSGYVTTWKVGGTYAPIDDIRFRVTRSRDIRAPNFSEAFTGGTTSPDPTTDPENGFISYQTVNVVGGNINLKPEKADSLSAGVVFQPTFLPGFRASFDYYDIEISDAIGTIPRQTLVNQCSAGATELCQFIIRDPATNLITRVNIVPFNFVTVSTRGFDIEASYQMDLDRLVTDAPGSLFLRGLATRVISYTQDNGIAPTRLAGQTASGSLPDWRWTLTGGYQSDRVVFYGTAGGVSSGVYNTDYIECTTNCPTSNSINQTINNNRVSSYFKFDAYISYKFIREGKRNAEVFFRVDNLFNETPPIVATPSSNYSWQVNTNPGLFDVIGRRFQAGVRFKM